MSWERKQLLVRVYSIEPVSSSPVQSSPVRFAPALTATNEMHAAHSTQHAALLYYYPIHKTKCEGKNEQPAGTLAVQCSALHCSLSAFVDDATTATANATAIDAVIIILFPHSIYWSYSDNCICNQQPSLHRYVCYTFELQACYLARAQRIKATNTRGNHELRIHESPPNPEPTKAFTRDTHTHPYTQKFDMENILLLIW